METVTIWRVQCGREGPFRRGRLREHPKFWDSISFPTPRIEGYPIPTNMVCGCTSIEQIEYWFGDTLTLKLLGEKAKVVRFEVPSHRVVFLAKQVLFSKKHGKLIEELPLKLLVGSDYRSW